MMGRVGEDGFCEGGSGLGLDFLTADFCARGASCSSAWAEDSAVVAGKAVLLVSVGEGSEGGEALEAFDTAFPCFFRIRSSYFALPDSLGFRGCSVALGVAIVVSL